MNEAGASPEVWLVDLPRAAPVLRVLEAATPRMSIDERLRADAQGADGEPWCALRIALRILLERREGPRLRGVSFAVDAAGKPHLPWPSDFQFSLSHSGPFGLIAIARGSIGVDVERPRSVRLSSPRRAMIVRAAAGIVADECRMEKDTGSQADDAVVLQAWVRLEAWAKARGTGIGALLSELGIWGARRTNGEQTDVAGLAAAAANRDGFRIADLDLPDRLHGAIALSGVSGAIVVRQFPTDRIGIAALA